MPRRIRSRSRRLRSTPFNLPDYDRDSFDAVLTAVLELLRHSPDSSRIFGARGEVDPVLHLLGAGFGWGGLPESEAFYLNVEPGLPVGAYKLEVAADVPVNAFRSVSLYNARGFFEPNTLDAYNVNSVTGERNADGSTTVHPGACDDGRVNCPPVMAGWRNVVRMYQPESRVIDGSWQFPGVVPAD